MAGPFDWTQVLTGQGGDNPYSAIANWSNDQMTRNRGAIGLDANGNPVAAPAAGGDSSNPQADGTSAATGQALATGVQPAGQEPQATKTPQSLGALMANLTQYQEREQGFNQSLGMGFAAFAQPRDREMVSKMFNVNQVDPLKFAQSEQDLAGQQQGQDRMNALGAMINDPTKGPQIAAALHMPGATPAEQLAALKAAYAANPQAVGQMITTTQAPTPQMANLEQINNYVAQLGQHDPSKTPEVLAMIKNAMISGMAGPDAEAAIGDAVAYKNRTGQDAPWVSNGAINQQAYKQYQANEAQKESDRGGAAKVLADNQNTSEELRSNLEQIRDSPGLKSILADPVKRAAASKALSDPTIDLPGLVAQNVLTKEESAAVATLRKIGGASSETAMRSMAGTGTRVTQQEVGPLKDAISSTQNLNQDYETYVHNAINPFITKIKKTVANAYGASGNLTHMDPEYEPWLHPIYRPGGELYKEGSGAENIPNLQPLTPGKLAWAKNEVTNYPAGKDDALDSLQQEGFDVSALRKTDPSKW